MADKTLLIKLRVSADGQPVINGFGRSLDELTQSESRLARQMRDTTAEARRQDMGLGGLTSSLRNWLGVLAGAAGIGVAAKKAFDYNQDIEGTQIAIAGLLYANTQYVNSAGQVVDEQTRYNAANAESLVILSKLQKESLKTAATVPQIADAFALVYGALRGAGISAPTDQIIQLTTRLTQAANAMQIPMDQIRQEINSLLTGQVTQDSTIAKRLGLDNPSIKQLTANGKLVEEVLKRTEGYAKAAEAQSNTVRGKLVNTTEIVIATLSRAIDPLLQKLKPALDSTFSFFATHGDAIVSFVTRVTTGMERGIETARKWIGEHQDLIKEILSMGAIAGVAIGTYALIGVAIAALTSPVTLAITGIVALALAWEKAREFSEIEVGGRPIAAYVRATMQIVGTAWAAGINIQIGAIRTLWNVAQAVFGGLVELTILPMRKLTELLARIPDNVAALVPGAATLKAAASSLHSFLQTTSDFFEPTKNLSEAHDAIRDTIDVTRELAIIGVENTDKALKTTDRLGGVSDLVKGAWESAAAWLNAKLPQLGQLGTAAANALAGLTAKPTATTPTSNDKGGKLADKLAAQQREYEEWINGFRAEAAAESDPLSEALARIQAEREDAISKLAEQKQKLGDALSWQKAGEDAAAIDAHFDEKALDAARKATEQANKETLEGARTLWRAITDIAAYQQEETEDRRIALISDAVEREQATRLAGIERWAREQRQQLTTSIQDEAIRSKALEVIETERQRRIAVAEDEAARAVRERTVGTAEFWKKTTEEIRSQFRTIAQTVTDVIVGSRNALANALNGFLDDLESGQSSVIKSLGGLAKGLSALWTKALTDVLMSGKNVAKQLKDLFESIHVKNEDGTTDWMGTALAGAGVGGAVGSLFGKPTNFAAEGGMIGGALGAVVGTLLGGNTALGTAIGSALGTAIGSMVQKGKDSIKVAIRDGIVSVTEKGISGEARAEITTQVQRRVKEEMKSWQALLDVLPQSVRDHLKELYASGQLKKPTLNVDGGIESADLTDEGALSALTDFLSSDVPKATFGAYSAAIRVALADLGTGKVRIEELFTYWGTLQGKELRDAVLRYVNAVVEGADLRSKIGASLDDKIAAARAYGNQKPLAHLDEISAAIDATVERMSGLTDVEDLVAAQEELNRLSKEYYDTQLQQLAHILSVESAISNSIAQQREQLQVGGMTDQGKADFFFERMVSLREQLQHATDADEINRLTQEIQKYVSQAYGLAPDNEEMRSKLISILDDIGAIAQSQLDKAKEAATARDDKPASALQRAAELLQKAAGDIADALKPPASPEPPNDDHPSPGGGEGKPPRNRDPNSATDAPEFTNAVQTLIAAYDESARTMTQVFAEKQTETVEILRELARTSPPTARGADASEIAAAVRAALNGMTLRGVTTMNGTLDVNTGELIDAAVATVIYQLKENPDLASRRT